MEASFWSHDSIVSLLLESKAEIEDLSIEGVRLNYSLISNSSLTCC